MESVDTQLFKLIMTGQNRNPILPDLIKKKSRRVLYPEDQEKYIAENVFWVPLEARLNHLKISAKQPTI